MKTAAFLLVIALIASGCTRLSDPGFDRSKLIADVTRGSVVRLADYTPFEWDRAHIFGPYTPAKVIKEEIGKSVPFPHVSSEEHCLLVFLSRNKIVAAFEVERKPCDFGELFRKAGYSREEAIFAIENLGSDHWRLLKKTETQPDARANGPERPWLILNVGQNEAKAVPNS